jgi:putative PIN family toxin of toxin-antitoxin system
LSPYRNVFDAFLAERYVLCLSTEVLLEYEEIFQVKWGSDVTENLLARVIRAENIELANVFFNFNLVTGDEDDNKFADLYITSNADYLVSNDAKLLALNDNEFPELKVITLQQFSQMLKNV